MQNTDFELPAGRPPMDSPADGLFREIKADMLGRLDLKRDMDDAEVMDIISEIVLDKTRRTYIRLDERRLLAERVFNSIRRLDVIQPLLDDAGISEIMVNGHRDIFVERDGKVRKTGLMFESAEKLEDVIQSIVSKVNRSVNESTPIADARLADGSRVNVVLKPIALDGPALTIRKFPDKPMSVARLLAFGSMDEAIAEFLGILVKARYNVLISGGTGSGKTSLLNAIAALIPSGERVITIEDSAELQLRSISNIVRLETRNANTEGKGAIGMGSLIKASLRMRPDRIIVGEVRDGPAAYYMLQSMNTGHDGSLTTGHANSAKDMLSRLETMVLSEEAMPIEAIRKQIASAIDVIVHVARLRDGSRKVVEISELAGVKDGGIQLNKLFEFLEGAAPSGRARGDGLEPCRGRPHEDSGRRAHGGGDSQATEGEIGLAHGGGSDQALEDNCRQAQEGGIGLAAHGGGDSQAHEGGERRAREGASGRAILPGSAADAVSGSFRRTGNRLRNSMKMSLAGIEPDLIGVLRQAQA